MRNFIMSLSFCEQFVFKQLKRTEKTNLKSREFYGDCKNHLEENANDRNLFGIRFDYFSLKWKIKREDVRNKFIYKDFRSNFPVVF